MAPTEKRKAAEGDHAGTTEGFDIEPLLQALGQGGCGLYQMIQVALQLVCIFQMALCIMAIVYIGHKPHYRCATVNDSKLEALIGADNSTLNMTVEYEQCNIKWDLTCEKSALTELSQTLMMVGQGLGAFGFTSLADRIGRKPVYVTNSIGFLAVSVAMAFSPNYYFFIVCRVLIGAMQQGSGLVAFTMFIELLPKKWRKLAGLGDGGSWSLGIMLLPGLAYAMRDYSWRHLQLLISGFSLVSLILPWCLDESLRWLVANKKRAAAERVLKKAARINGVPYHKVHQALDAILSGQTTEEVSNSTPANENTETLLGYKSEANDRPEKLPLDEEVSNSTPANENTEKLLGCESEANDRPEKLPLDETPHHHDDSANGKVELKEPIVLTDANGLTEQRWDGVKKYTALDVVRSKLMAKITLYITYLWIANALTYYGLMLTSGSVSGDRFLNFFLQALMEFPAYLTVFLCLRKFGRKNVTCGFLCLAAGSLLLSSLLLATVSSPVVGPVTNVLSLMGKYGVSGSFSALFIFCPEMYPTNMRTAGLGIASALARLGGMVAPYSNNLAEVALWAPGILFGVMCLLGVVVMLQLPETRGRPMPTTIEEIQHWRHTPATTQGPPHAHHH